MGLWGQSRISSRISNLEYAKKAANWLKSLAVTEDNGAYKWPTAESSQSYMIGIDSGTAGAGMFFLELYHVTKDREYLEYAEGAGRYLLNSHFKDGQVDWLNGAAGVGNSFAIYYSYDPQPDNNYLEYAKGSAHWLMSASEFPSFEQVKWINYVEPEDTDYGEKEYQTAWYKGVSGVGLFFLNLSQTLPPPLAGNLAPVLNPIGNKTIRTDQELTFSTSGHDPDESPGPLIIIAGNLPRGAIFKDNDFSWTPDRDQAGTFDIYFMVTDGWDGDWEHITIDVTKLKKGKIIKMNR